MFGFFKRLFNIGKANANKALDSLENPITMTEQGIRDLKEDLDNSLKSLAEIKATAIRTHREAESQKQLINEYDQKARALLIKGRDGGMDINEAKRLAAEALARKEENLVLLQTTTTNATKYDGMVESFKSKIGELKSKIAQWDSELRTLKARHEMSKASTNINKQLAGIDSSDTLSMLERMRDKIEQQEALSDSYAELAGSEKSIDAEINKALEGHKGAVALDNLLAEMGMNEKPIELPVRQEPLQIEEKKEEN